jgi:NAD dependent epimerase/dehydratase family
MIDRLSPERQSGPDRRPRSPRSPRRSGPHIRSHAPSFAQTRINLSQADAFGRHLELEWVSLVKIIVVGASGTIGSEVMKALSARRHEVIDAHRGGEVEVSLEDAATIRAMFEKIRGVDAVVPALATLSSNRSSI